MSYYAEQESYADPGQKSAIDSTFETMVTSSMGVRAVTNRIKIKAIMKAYNFVKNSFGFESYIYQGRTFRSIVDYFENTCNVSIMTDQQKLMFPEISVTKFVKVDYNTFLFITWEHSDNPLTKSSYMSYMYIFGKRSYKHYKYINENILNPSTDSSIRHTNIYTVYASNNNEGWQGVRTISQSRPFSTLYFDNDIEEKIKAHIDTWMKNKDVYRERGITFKTGILLYGSPGTGKSSIALAVADYMNCNIIMVDSATFKDLNVNELTASINADDKMYVIVLDDIDVILTSREDDKATMEDKANISKLLGFLDSGNSPNNVIFIATTNHIELFDSAITRAGRFDKIFEITNISKDTAIRMCEGFGLSHEQAKELIAVEGHNKSSINPADLQVKIIDKIKQNINSETV